MKKILRCGIIVIFILILSVSAFSQKLNDKGQIKFILESSIGNDSIDIIIYSDYKLIREFCNPFEENQDSKSYTLDINPGQYDVLIQSQKYPLILYKDVPVKKRKKTFLIIDYSNIDTKSMRLQFRKYSNKIM